MIITTVTDIGTYIDDTRGDIRAETGAAGVSAAVEALRAAEHPAWGTDWSEWLSDDGTQDLITEAAGDA